MIFANVSVLFQLKHRKTRTCSRKRPTACKDHPFDGKKLKRCLP